MQIVLENTPFGVIVYEETLLTGKRTVRINGVTLNCVNKLDYIYRVGESVTVFRVVNDRKKGTLLVYSGGEILLLGKPAFYETVFAWLGFLAIIVWGSSPALCKTLPVLGGLLGGAIGGAFAGVGIYLIRKADHPLKRILIPLGTSLLAFALCTLIGFLITG